MPRKGNVKTMNATQQTQQKNAQKSNASATNAPAAKPANVEALERARAVRVSESERRAKLTPQALFKEDLTDVTNRVADLIDGQRGALIGVVARGLRDQKDESGKSLGAGLTPEQCKRALTHIAKSLQRVADAIEKPTATEEERFTL